MWKGRSREEWDRTVAVQQTIMAYNGFAKPKRMPTVEDMNPIRNAEQDEIDDDDEFDSKMKKLAR